ncbi:MAG TPA: DegT/DnrJ/EryC1/StrS family aminotransferase [Bryobacteraceae bacterium]|nr:DegT/DnrJ/EryC1/StrS family aminotransferase [Bryobacteraceae bacterium]
MSIPLSAPDILQADIDAVVQVLRTPRISLGPKLEEFELGFARYIGVPHAVALSSGTAGLHLGLLALGIEEGDEVILPAFTFIAAANAILHARARPVFVDIDARTLNLDPGEVERAITPRTRAILVVHTFGVPADMAPLTAIARKHGLRVIEDACEAIGAEYGGQRVGAIGDLGVFAFYPNKPITTGEGGMVTTRDAKTADTIRALRNQGRRPTDGWLDHSLLGYNFRISEMNCALGIAQMRRIDEILARRAAAAARYFEELRGVPGLTLPVSPLAWFVFVIRAENRDEIASALAAHGIATGRYFAPLHRQPLFAPFVKPGDDFRVTEKASAQTLALPFFTRISAAEIATVAQHIKQVALPTPSP